MLEKKKKKPGTIKTVSKWKRSIFTRKASSNSSVFETLYMTSCLFDVLNDHEPNKIVA